MVLYVFLFSNLAVTGAQGYTGGDWRNYYFNIWGTRHIGLSPFPGPLAATAAPPAYFDQVEPRQGTLHLTHFPDGRASVVRLCHNHPPLQPPLTDEQLLCIIILLLLLFSRSFQRGKLGGDFIHKLTPNCMTLAAVWSTWLMEKGRGFLY